MPTADAQSRPRPYREQPVSWHRTRVTTYLRSDAALAVVVGLVVAAVSLGHDSTAIAACAGALLLALPLVWRCRWPMGVLVSLAVGVPVYLTFAEPTPVFTPPMLIALYTVAAHGTRWRTLAVALLLVPWIVAIVTGFHPDDGNTARQCLQLITQFGFALAVGEAVRTQRAFVSATRERAEREKREQVLEARRRLEEERMQIARDVHDVVSHSIATISTQASVGAHIGRDEPQRAVEALESIKKVSVHALHDLRHALGVLRDPSGEDQREPTPTVQGVPGLVQRARESGLAVDLEIQGRLDQLPAALEVTVYRIVQEGLTNVMRHAPGSRAIVRLAVGEGEIEVKIVDDGGEVAGPVGEPGLGVGSGLAGLRERAAAVGGELSAGPVAGGGFCVRATLPLDGEGA
jgi:signal transduction histidine kinase